jgi:hypothetical protein
MPTAIGAKVMFSPGHTMASITYVMGDAAFVHDTLFMPDSGTARADFPGGSAKVLWKSIQDILALPDETRIFTGHDYQPDGREPLWESTVTEQEAKNIHMAKYRTKAEFVAVREARDKTLPISRLILPSLQINTNGGRLPEPESNGRRHLNPRPINRSALGLNPIDRKAFLRGSRSGGTGCSSAAHLSTVTAACAISRICLATVRQHSRSRWWSCGRQSCSRSSRGRLRGRCWHD